MGPILSGFRANAQNKCSICGKIFGPLDKIYRQGATQLCQECKDKQQRDLRAADAKNEQSFIALLETIKKCYGVQVVPKKILYQIDKIIENDPRKNYANIGYTLNYAYTRMGVLSIESGVAGIIGYFYEDAAKNYAQTKEVYAHNLEFTPTDNTVTVVLHKSDKPQPVFKPKSNIEDL